MDEAEQNHHEFFEPGFGPGAMGYLAPARFDDEALSGWLVRIAHANYLTLKELLKLTGLCWYRLDEGRPDQVEALSRMLGAPVDAARRNLRRDPEALPPSPAYSWVVCPYCLDGDIASNHAPYIRLAWSDPLAT